MRLIAFATDYDGTLAHHGRVDAPTITALERLKASGRKLLMVTGRELPDLKQAFDRLDLFDVVVAENGSLLYFPASQEEQLVADEPPPELIAALRERQVEPLSVGRGIVATWEPNEGAVLDAIRESGLEWQIIFNKGAVMVLPAGVNKATGLAAALEALRLSPLNVVGIGDAENDHAFLTACGCSVAVANALDAVKATAALVTSADHGAGVTQAIDALLAEPSPLVAAAASARAIAIGPDADADLAPDRGGVLIAGSSGFGKSTLATALIEKLEAQGFQMCVLDPEGDYTELEGAIVLGDAKHEPVAIEAMGVLENPASPPLVINMLGLKVADRPAFFRETIAQICKLQVDSGRPHWLVVDEAHHMLPVAEAGEVLPPELSAVIYVTVHPDQMAPAALRTVRTLLCVGPKGADVAASFCSAVGIEAPDMPDPPDEDQVLYWDVASGQPPRWIVADPPHQARKRHTRKYAEGELGADKSFYFQGPDGALNLRAQNLIVFLQMADGVDDATWLHHLRQGDYVRWFREAIKDDELADEALGVQDDGDARASREAMREIIERRYTAPAQT
ncbi:phosphoglycolate phosphatase [Phenylobacterium sp. Root77]|jgi:hydroxymethylpyrimidine pyrophosphatase-like HAD family hydrolase|uniref:HAD family hydrolase n=1 Tax=unclassified Phenylobacterium TaxID=2640670 RepID=UPI0006F6F934|nr:MULTISPECIES: HAD family hydrolase [unclassified Phenylobacterium]KQW65558.1 phosphoglycolate phosphatase [Phenylobacterium sp. Root1277]KQW94243.1 phosphoglycolate phosphatase [Phenylobacterium sp. Root1290]KRC38955.1 phosphoglycolate phosphatase [Phenylobacterium sp. Root77]